MLSYLYFNRRPYLSVTFQSRQRLKEQLCKSVSLSVTKLYKQLHISSLAISSSCQLSHQSMLGHQTQLHLSLALASYISHQSIVGHQVLLNLYLALALSFLSLSLQLSIVILLLYVRPSVLAPSLLSLILSLTKGIATVSHFRFVIYHPLLPMTLYIQHAQECSPLSLKKEQ